MSSNPLPSLGDLPADLPVPVDDGACKHLVGMRMPAVVLRSTANRDVDLSALAGSPRTVIYCYPMTGVPGVPLPDGWDAIPGARGCTPQSCSFRDHHQQLADLGASVYGLSTQSTSYQQEVVGRLHLPFEILSDEKLAFVHALKLPILEVAGMKLVKRITLFVREGRIEHVFYPVFPPTESAAQVVKWLEQNRI